MVEFDWQKFVAEEEVIVILRFSFYGRSGWKSEFSRNQDQLFGENRLKLRLKLLQKLPLASLAAQTDQKFHLFILTSKLMPGWALKGLHEACAASLPAEKFTINPRPAGLAGEYVRRFLRARATSHLCFQVVLDDDDALAADFIQRLRPKMAELSAPEPGDVRFVSFARGYALDLNDDAEKHLRMYRHRYPYINLGLAMVGTPRGPNLLTIEHRKKPQKHEHSLIGAGKRMFIRCIHTGNDSRVEVSEGWGEVSNWRSQRDIKRRFGFLEGI